MKRQKMTYLLIVPISFVFFVSLLALFLAPAAAVGPTQIIIVNTTADELNTDGDCSLREAVRAANLDSAVDGCSAGNGADEISIPSGTYTLTLAGDNENAALTGDLDITGAVTIEGVSAAETIIRSAVADRVFHVLTTSPVAFDGLTIRDGQEMVFGGGGLMSEVGSQVQIANSIIVSNTASGGGGISNGGMMIISLSTIANNSAATFSGGALITGPAGKTTLIQTTVRDNEAVAGGALSTFNGDIVIVESILSNNQATSPTDGGGAMRVTGGSTVVDVINSTISGNSSIYDGGGIYAFNMAVINLHNVTVADNSTDGSGGGIHVTSSAVLNSANTILADNVGATNPDCAATVNSLGYNLIENVSANCVINGNMTGVLTGVDPQLGALQDNGGPTLTQALSGSSPAVNGGNPSGCTDPFGQPLTTDQRGFPRPVGGACDMGAFEAAEANFAVYMPVVVRP